MVGVCSIMKGEHDESCMSTFTIHIKKEKNQKITSWLQSKSRPRYQY